MFETLFYSYEFYIQMFVNLKFLLRNSFHTLIDFRIYTSFGYSNTHEFVTYRGMRRIFLIILSR